MIGNFLRNLYKALGYNVVGINYLGDWGKQYGTWFVRVKRSSSPNNELLVYTGLLAVGFNEFGSEEELVKNPIRHLYDVYVNINKKADANEEVGKEIHNAARAYFKKMEEGMTLPRHKNAITSILF